MCDPVTGAIVGGADLASGIIGSNASNKASKQLANSDMQAMTQANQYLKDFMNTYSADLQPYQKAGTNAINTLNAGVAPGGEFNNSFTMQDFMQNQDPAYNFDVQQGQLALERSAAANGTLNSGGTLKAITGYGQQMASNEFGNAYNRFMTTRQNNFSNLSGIAGFGQNANQQYGTVGSAVAGQESGNTMQAIMGAGAAQAGGTIGSANALTGALSQFGNFASGQNTLAQLMQMQGQSSYKPAGGASPQLPWQQPGYAG